MRVIVCGSRTFTDVRLLHVFLDGLHVSTPDQFTLIEGGARGADGIASRWAAHTPTVEHLTYMADWASEPRRAGVLRNQRMLDDGRPDLVVAFVDKPLAESRGTADMVRRARKAGVKTVVVTSETA